MEIYSRLRQLIETKGVTPYEISAQTGISEATLSRMLNKVTKKPNIRNLEMLAKYFQVNIDWLRTGEGEMLKTDQPGAPTNTSSDPTIERLLSIIESQQRTIENFSKKM